MLLKEGAVGVIPTDTIYGICGSAFNKKTVEKIYKLRKRNLQKPFIILIGDIDDLKKFGINLKDYQRKFLNTVWLVENKQSKKVSVILECPLEEFAYLHRGTKTIAFRIPKNKELIKILEISGPLVAPSANFEGCNPAKNIKEAKKYFGHEVFYLNRGNLISKPSRLFDLTKKPIRTLR